MVPRVRCDKVGRRKAEDGVRRARGGPDRVERHQSFVDEHDRLGRVPDRGHAADGEAGRLAHEIGVGARDPLADVRGGFFLVDPVRAGGDHQHAPPARGPEDQRLCDLSHRAADRGRGVLGRARARVEFEHGEGRPERGLNFERRGGDGGLHGVAPQRMSKTRARQIGAIDTLTYRLQHPQCILIVAISINCAQCLFRSPTPTSSPKSNASPERQGGRRRPSSSAHVDLFATEFEGERGKERGKGSMAAILAQRRSGYPTGRTLRPDRMGRHRPAQMTDIAIALTDELAVGSMDAEFTAALTRS